MIYQYELPWDHKMFFIIFLTHQTLKENYFICESIVAGDNAFIFAVIIVHY